MMAQDGLEPAAALPGAPRLRWPWAATAATCLLAAMVIGTLLGPAHLGFGETFTSLLSRVPFLHVHSSLDDVQRSILWSLRVPRVVLGALVGGTLALAGASHQAALRNPLDDPYLLGAAAGAELGATLAIAGRTCSALLLLEATRRRES
jgi:iron complex transport system permease protein